MLEFYNGNAIILHILPAIPYVCCHSCLHYAALYNKSNKLYHMLSPDQQCRLEM